MCRLVRFATLAFAVAFVQTDGSLGQSIHSAYVPSNHDHSGGRFGHYGWFGGYHASTAAEGYARGLADVIRARGEANLTNALAQREWEAARQQRLENQVLKVQKFYERRALFAENHQAEIALRREKAAARLERIRLTELTSQELNPETGTIAWPTLLADEAFADYRQWFDALFRERAKYGPLSAGTLGDAEALIKQWRSELTAVRDQVPEAVLRDSLRFLLRLDRELEHNFG